MSSFSVDGLVSGVNTSGLIDAVMAVERLPQLALKDKVKNFDKAITAMQGINSKLKSLGDLAKDISQTQTWERTAATSSSEAVTVTSTANSPAATLDFNVLSLAQAHTEVSGTFVVDPESTPDPSGVTVTKTEGPPPVLNLSAGTPDPRAIAMAINSTDHGYTAQAIQVAPGEYRLQVQSINPGSINNFTFNINSVDSTNLKTGTDAVIELGPGFQVTSSDNTFEDIMQGVTIEVSKVEDNVKVDIGTDDDAVKKDVKGFVDNLNELLSDMSAKTNMVPGSDMGAGPLAGSSTMRQLQSQVVNAATGYAGDGAAYEAGIEIDRYGKLTFDEEAFAELYASDPEKAQSIVADIASKVGAVTKQYSDSVDGMLTQQIKSKQGQVRGLNDQIENWDRRMELREANMKRQFSAMEGLLSGIKSQSSWLMGQLGAAAKQG